VPIPIFLSEEARVLPSVLAVGAELKNTICLTKENRAFLSQHVGDMENMETFEFFELTLAHLKRILQVTPEIIAHDMHPDYLSSQYARQQKEISFISVQHHHAHIVSCLAENRVIGPVIGIALDGTGLGPDGQIWGGEVLLADVSSFMRAAHFDNVPMPGGNAAIRFPWRMALSYLYRTYGEALFDLQIEFLRRLEEQEASVILQMVRRGINSPLTSSCGRLFDAVSSLIGLRHWNAYEGQAAVELEMCQRAGEKGKYSWSMEKKGRTLILATAGIIACVVEDLKKGVSRGTISARFHNTLIDMLSAICLKLREETGLNQVALSGGAFQNVTLLSQLTGSLAGLGFQVYAHRLVPANDGGLSLGQALCAGMRRLGFLGEYGLQE
jgi:hydrogenase maturation protein HypF